MQRTTSNDQAYVCGRTNGKKERKGATEEEVQIKCKKERKWRKKVDKREGGGEVVGLCCVV